MGAPRSPRTAGGLAANCILTQRRTKGIEEGGAFAPRARACGPHDPAQPLPSETTPTMERASCPVFFHRDRAHLDTSMPYWRMIFRSMVAGSL